MIRRLFNKIKGALDKPEPPAPRPRKAKPTRQFRDKVKQVFEGRAAARPEFVHTADASGIIELCKEQVACAYQPHFAQKRIYTTKQGFDGNLEIEYEGIAGSCGAIKSFGKDVAKEYGQMQAFRYVNLNHIYGCCCGEPPACPFYRRATRERTRTAKHMRILPGAAD